MTRLLPDLIETERLRLRQPRVTDAEIIFESYATDPEVCRYMIWQAARIAAHHETIHWRMHD